MIPHPKNNVLYDVSPAAVVATVIPSTNGKSICAIAMKNLIPIVATPGALKMISDTAG